MSKQWLTLLVVGVVFAVRIDEVTPYSLDRDQAISSEELSTYIGKQLETEQSSLEVAAQALDLVPSPTAPQALCAAANNGLTSQKHQLQQGASAAIILAKLQCTEKSAAVSALPQLWDAALQEDSLAGYAAILAASRHTAGSKTQITKEQVEAAGKLLSDLKAPSGKARSQAGAAVSILATGYAYKIISEGKALKVKWPGKASTAATEFTDQISEVLEGASENGLIAAGDGAALQALSQFLEGVVALNAKAPSSKQLTLLAQYVSSFQTVGSLEEAVWLLKAKLALKALGASAVKTEIATAHLTLGQKGAVEIVTRDEEGQLVAAQSLKASVSDSKGNRLAVVESLEGSEGRYKLDLLDHVKNAGQYRISLTPNPGAGSSAQDHAFIVKESSQYKSASLAVLKENEAELESETALWPEPTDTVLNVPRASVIRVTLSGATSKQTPVLRIACKQSNEALVVAFKKGLKAQVASSIVQEELQCQEVEVSLQPASAATETVWALGTIKLSGAVAKPGREDQFAPKPTIRHLFRTPDKRPLEALSFLFAGIAALPLAVLVFGLHKSGANLKGLSSHSKQLSLPAFVFHSSLVGLVLLYSAFWLKLNLLQTLPLLALLALVLSVSGYFLLSTQAALRLKQT